jgi:ATP-binding cassette, subfamily B, bacterial
MPIARRLPRRRRKDARKVSPLRLIIKLRKFRARPFVETTPHKRTWTIGELLKPHWRALAFGFLAVIGEGIADLAEPWPLKVVLDTLLHSHSERWLNKFILSIAGTNELAILKLVAVSVLAIAALGAICSYAEKYLTTSVGQWVMYDLRRSLYSHMQRLSIAYHDQKQTGDLIGRATTDVDAIQSFLASGLLGALVNSITLIGMVTVMLFINWRFTLIALSVVPPLFLIVFHYTRLIKKSSREVRKKESQIVSTIQEVLTSIRVVKAFAREDYEQRRLEEESLEGVEIALRARGLKAKLTPIVEIIVAFGTMLVLWFGARMVLSGSLLASDLVLFIFYLGKMYKPIQELSKLTDSYSKASIGYERIREVLEMERDVKDMPGARRAAPFKGQIEFEKAGFFYTPDKPILTDVSLKVEVGQLAALVGPTGAGKTTIVSLIARFYDPTSGVVKIDGTDIRRFTQKSLREQISFVLQDTVLFHGPVWRNIAYGKPEATRAEILKAAELANAHEFIQEMPEGYDTIVGERGNTLSGGQRQRIAIARAVIRNTPILILDEPSSGLDAASEKLVFEALERLMKGKTSVVIAHRLATIRQANVIFVVDKGTIVESGTEAELLQHGGLYSELHEIQFSVATDDAVPAK